jgi:predicted dehydrogenase
MGTDRSLRAGVIGAGAIAQACHLPGYARNPHVDLAAFADPIPARHEEIAKQLPSVKGYHDYNEMLAREHLEVVSVCTPNKYHAAATLAALDAGCHVLCEKPMALTLGEAGNMIAAARRKRRKLMIAFTNRLYTGPNTCKELLQKKAIGKPFMMRVRFGHGGPYPGWAKGKWFYQAAIAAGGVMFDMGIHAIDLCLWLMGPIQSVSAKAATLIKKIEVDDNALLMLEFKNGALGYIDVSWTSKPGFTGFEIYGTEGSLICDYVRGLQLCSGTLSAGTDSVTEWQMLDKAPATGGWDIEIDHWIDVVLGKTKLTMDGKAGRDALAVALAAYRSSASGKRVVLR